MDPFGGSASAGDPGSWNRFTYAGGDPIGLSDPIGTDTEGPVFSLPGITATAFLPSLTLYFTPAQLCLYSPAGGCYCASVNAASAAIANAAQAATSTAAKAVGDAQKLLNNAIWAAVHALQDSKCAALFNTNASRPQGNDPATVLLLFGLHDSPFGDITAANIRLSNAAETDAVGGTIPVGPNAYSPYVASAANIVLQNSFGYWQSQTVATLAITLIHELGHVYNIVAGLGGSAILWDGNSDGSPNSDAQAKNRATLNVCHPH